MATDATHLSPLERLRARPPATGTYTFAFDPAAAEAISAAEEAVTAARRTTERQPKSDMARKALTKAERALRKLQADTVTVTITIQAVGYATLEALQHEHPPTDEQIAAAEGNLPEGQRLVHDPDTYGPAALAASLARLEFSDDPDGALDTIDTDDAKALWDGLGHLDKLQVLGMITAINMRSAKVDLVGKD